MITTRYVNPGDLITSTDWNNLVRAIEDIETRLELLEANSIGGPVAITQLIYTAPLRLGQTLQIQGRNFGTSRGAQQAQFDDKFIIDYGGGSDDSTLFVIVPTDLHIVDENGQDVMLRVSNGGSSDSRTIKILPLDIPASGNLVDLSWVSVEPNPLVPTQPATLDFKAYSRARNPAYFNVTINISDSTLQTGKKLLAGNEEVPDLRLHLTPLTDFPFSISLPKLPDSLADGQFRVFIRLQSGSMFGSLTKDFVVGSNILTPDTFEVNPDQLIVYDDQGLPVLDDGNYDSSTNTIKLRASRTGTMTMEAKFSEQDTYDYSVKVISGTGWSVVIGDSDHGSVVVDAGDFAAGPPATKPLEFDLSAASDASTSGEVEFTVQRQDHNPDSVRMLLALK